ncbi:hypothetical protein ACFX13_025713 [Malus domestica]
MLVEVDSLKSKGSFEEVATESLPVGVVHEMPTEPTVGMGSMFDQVWRYVEDEQVGAIGLYGMGGVGKTTLLTKIHYKFAFSTSYHFDLVIWIVVSKDHKLQEKVGKEALQSHPDIPKLAQVVANECDGLPLALITVGRAMTCKKTPHEWNHAIRVLKESASEFSVMGGKEMFEEYVCWKKKEIL